MAKKQFPLPCMQGCARVCYAVVTTVLRCWLYRLSGLKSMLLEKRVEVLSEALEMKDAQLGEVLAAAHLDPATLQQVRQAVHAQLHHTAAMYLLLFGPTISHGVWCSCSQDQVGMPTGA
jgi:hypothetical protein